VSTERIGLLVLDHLREVDHVAYVRFASVYKGFDEAADFERGSRFSRRRLLRSSTEAARIHTYGRNSMSSASSTGQSHL
jgi:hypothetical protein